MDAYRRGPFEASSVLHVVVVGSRKEPARSP
jgi:hypothetical protein